MKQYKMTSLFTNLVWTLCYATTPTTTEFTTLLQKSETQARTNNQLRHARQANRRKLYSDRPDHKKDFVAAIQL